MPKTLSQRKQYAIQCLIKGRTGTRAYDDCFEEGDGGEVVKHIMKICLTPLPDLPYFTGSMFSPEYNKWRRSYLAKRRKDALTRAVRHSGTWDYWLHYYTHGNCDGYKRKVS